MRLNRDEESGSIASEAILGCCALLNFSSTVHTQSLQRWLSLQRQNFQQNLLTFPCTIVSFSERQIDEIQTKMLQ